MKTLLRNQLSKASGVGHEALRFYERKGLLPVPRKSPSGYRLYPVESLTRLRFIRNAKEIGFSLKEITSLLTLRASDGVTCADVRKRVDAKVKEVDQKLRALEKIRGALLSLRSRCQPRLPASDCPILDELEAETNGDQS